MIGIKIWFTNRFIVENILGRTQSSDNKEGGYKHYVLLWSAVASFVLIGGVFTALALTWQTTVFQENQQVQNTKIHELTEITESLRKNNQVYLMSNVLNQVEEELDIKPNGPLSDAIIARIASLSHSFKPYRIIQGDSLTKQKLSPERAQLLISLALMGIDSNSFAKIKQLSTFSYSDLRSVTLKDVDLSGINLEYADLSYSNLFNVNMRESNLKSVTMSASTIKECDFSYSEFNSSTIINSYISYSSLNNCVFNGSVLCYTNISHCTMDKSTFDVANISHGKFISNSMKETDLARSNLQFATFHKINLTNGRLIKANLTGAQLSEVLLEGVEVHENILQSQIINKRFNSDSQSKNYKVVSLKSSNVTKYFLQSEE